MSKDNSRNVTQALHAIRQGDAGGVDRLFGLVYEELKRIAGAQMRKEKIGHTLQTTALVNEAVIRLLNSDALKNAENRSYFFGAASRAMRQVLVDHARRRGALIRGGDRERVPLDDVLASFEDRNINVIDLDEALKDLSAMSERQAEIVTRWYFGGFTQQEIADQLGKSIGTIENDLRIAKAWLRSRLGA